MPKTELTFDEIRKYIDEHGPKRVKNNQWSGLIGTMSYGVVKGVELVCRVLKVFEDEEGEYQYYDSIAARIQEILPEEGQVLLSGNKAKVIIFDEDKRLYKLASLDICTGQPIPTEEEFDLTNHNPLTDLELISFKEVFYGKHFKKVCTYSKVAGFLEATLEKFNHPTVIEIGKHMKNESYPFSINYLFPMKGYAK